MCITAIIAAGVAIASAGAQAVSSIGAANANKKAANYEAAMQTKQLYRQQQMEHIAALQQENARAEEFNQARSSALAAIGASGLGEHITFFQGADPAAKKAFLRDVSTVRLNMDAEKASIADQVGVTEYKRRISNFNSDMSKVGAVAEFVKTSMQAVSMYSQYSTPKAASSGGGK